MTTRQEVGEHFITALRAADFTAIGSCLTPAVRLRALLPTRMVDAEGREPVVALLRDWLQAGVGLTVLDASVDTVGRRLHLSYLVRLDADDGPRVMQQQAYCDVTADGIGSVRLLCSGGMPVQAFQH
jgi:ketosteroid isomerase-like protein